MNSSQGQRTRTQQPILPLEALTFLLSDAFEPDQEPALIKVIQGDRRIELDDDEIAYVLADAKSAGMDAQIAFNRLLTVGQAGSLEAPHKIRPR